MGTHYLKDSRFIFASVLLAGFGFGTNAQAMDVEFTDDAFALNLTHFGQTHGQSWGDFNADGFADLYISFHGEGLGVYRNEAGQSFTLVNDTISADLTGDIHSAAWGDFDNDGDRDLLFVEGASGGVSPSPSRLLVNNNGSFVDQAATYNLEQEFARARSAGWVDWNNDGLLDATLTNFQSGTGVSPTSLYTRTGGTFVSQNTAAGYNPTGSNTFATLIKTNGQDEPVLAVNTVYSFPLGGIYDMTQLPFTDLRPVLAIPTVGAVWEFVAADFDGDLDQEIFLPRQSERSEIALTSDTFIQAAILGLTGYDQGFTFKSTEPVSFDIGPTWDVPFDFFAIGANSGQPDSHQFTLDPTDPEVWGTPVHDEFDVKLYIYYDTVESEWHVELTNRLSLNMHITTTGVFSELGASDSSELNFEAGGRTARLLDQTQGGYVDVAAQRGVANPYPCMSAAVADYDNDMDVDIFMACSGAVANAANVLLENDGAGNFTEVVGAAGMTGTIVGRSHAANTADINNDGFVDVIVTNGFGVGPNGAGPTEMFVNGGNDNHWIHLNLEGTTSNRDGVGAWVVLTAGGKSQSRLQANGARRYGQDHQRIHFGLGDNAIIDEIVIRWPGGQQQTLNNVAADQILTVVQEADSDGDSVLDANDNCRFVANPLQIDADGDGYGNFCDADLNNDEITNFLDLSLFSAVFLSSDPVADFNSDGAVNFVDFAVFADFYLQPPGP